ncbi:Cyclopropane-fatty-acyl-phospholipid synthase (EC [Olavius algarvensis Delta 1 endosymbiont]|nr:Cyclopropane-fatty-acyl-phospholipid synthase (EC [Olavius algarvensis Delta 1 endosymbiont]
MKGPAEKRLIQQLLDYAGVRVDGHSSCDIQIHNPDFYPRVIAGGSLALGESYIDGWWDSPALDQFFERIMAARLDKMVRKSKALLWQTFKARLTRMHGRARGFEVGRRHYDIGNDLFTAMLDKRMNYSCAYWQEAVTLDEAQEAKLELTCRKLGLEPGMRVLDIGCGWGGFAIYAAERYGAEVTGVTVSVEQVKLGQTCSAGLPVHFELKDYRDIQGTFDRIVSIGMFEHVGLVNYRTYMRVVNRCLNDDGLFLLHTIGSNTSVRSVDPWLAKYIFPNSMLPSARQITEAAEGIFIMEDWHSFGTHYDPTLMAWHRNFIDNWHFIRNTYDDRFQRMWVYYLLSCAGSFRARRNQLWQIVFSKNGGREKQSQGLNHISPTHRIR